MSDVIQEEVLSPCIGVCSIDEASGYCHGCYRTIEEIKAWWNMSPAEQQALVDTLDVRQTQTVSFD